MTWTGTSLPSDFKYSKPPRPSHQWEVLNYLTGPAIIYGIGLKPYFPSRSVLQYYGAPVLRGIGLKPYFPSRSALQYTYRVPVTLHGIGIKPYYPNRGVLQYTYNPPPLHGTGLKPYSSPDRSALQYLYKPVIIPGLPSLTIALGLKR